MIHKIKIDYGEYEYNESMLKLAIKDCMLKVEDCEFPIIAFTKDYFLIEAPDYSILRNYNLQQCSAILKYHTTSHGSPILIKDIILQDNAPYDKLVPLNWDPKFRDGVKLNVYSNNRILPEGLFACHEDEEPSRTTLARYKGKACCWGFSIEDSIFYTSGEIAHLHTGILYRNKERFYTVSGTLDYCLGRLLYMINRVYDHPAELCNKDYDKKLIGRRIWFKEQPAKIVWCINGYIGVAADYNDGSDFKKIGSDKYEEIWDDEDTIKVGIFSDLINWFRDEGQE